MSKSKLFVYYQPNDKDLKDTYYDDPIRALTKILNLSWVEVFDDMVTYARELQCSFVEKQCYDLYLMDKGFIYVGVSNKKGTKRPTVESFTREHKEGRYFLNIANHSVASVDGFYYNTWDCGQKSLYGYWYMK